MRALLIAFCILTAGCTIRHECVDQVTDGTASALGQASFARCGIGYCVTMRSSVSVFRFRLPMQTGVFTLEDLGAEGCDTTLETCAPLTGSMTVREVHPPAQGQPVGRLDADVDIAEPLVHASIDYREDLEPYCHAVTWPDLGPWPGGPE